MHEEPRTRPIIALTASEFHTAANGRNIMHACPTRYLHAIHNAGGTPILISPYTPSDALEQLLATVDGLLVTGGPDIDPARYGQPAHPNTVLPSGTDDADRTELEALRIADEHDLPTLCICRGTQILNVHRGGTLYQHLPDLPWATVTHAGGEEHHDALHDVHVAPGSIASHIFGASVQTNSFHHQAVADLGWGLQITGRATDGVVEILEDPDRSLLIGVQWHPETMAAPGHGDLFARLVAGPHRRGRPWADMHRAGLVTVDRMIDWVSLWHSTVGDDDGLSLTDALGLTADEYAMYEQLVRVGEGESFRL